MNELKSLQASVTGNLWLKLLPQKTYTVVTAEGVGSHTFATQKFFTKNKWVTDVCLIFLIGFLYVVLGLEKILKACMHKLYIHLLVEIQYLFPQVCCTMLVMDMRTTATVSWCRLMHQTRTDQPTVYVCRASLNWCRRRRRDLMFFSWTCAGRGESLRAGHTSFLHKTLLLIGYWNCCRLVFN